MVNDELKDGLLMKFIGPGGILSGSYNWYLCLAEEKCMLEIDKRRLQI